MTAREYRDRADKKAELGNFKDAITDYTKAIELNLNVLSSKGFLVALEREGHTKTMKSKPGDFLIYLENDFSFYGRGSAKLELNDYYGAINDFTEAIKINPDFVICYLERGEARYNINDYQGAIADYTSIIKIIPEFENAYGQRGSIKYDIEDYQGSIEDFTNAIEIDPSILFNYFYRGLAKSSIGDYEGSISDFTKAIQLDPDLPNPYIERGFEKAMKLYYHDAVADCTMALKLNPKSDSAYKNRGIAKIGLNDYEGAVTDFKKAIDIDSENKHDNFIETYFKIKKLGSRPDNVSQVENYANQLIRICDEFNNDTSRFYIYIHDILCDAFIMKKEYERAIHELEGIIDELEDGNPNIWKYCVKMSDLYLKSGNVKDAIDCYKLALLSCDDNVHKIDLDKKLQRLTDEYNNQFIELPYSQRKWVVVADDKTTPSNNVFVVLDQNKLPSTIKFPLGHTLKEELYIGHPFIRSSYMLYSEYDSSLFIDRYNEFKLFIQCLGAKSMKIEVIKGSEKSSSIIDNRFSDKGDTISGNASASYGVYGGNASGSSSNSSASTHNYNRGTQEDLQTSRATIQQFNPKKKPYLSSKLIWYNNEPTWQRLFEQRMAGGILHHSETWSSKSNYSISEKEEKSLKEAYKEFVSADIGIAMFKADVRIDTDGHSNKTELVDKTFNQSESIEWRIEIEFEPIENLLEDYTETEPINTIAVCTSTSNKDEEEYLEEVKFHLEDDGEIDEKERSALERFREKRGISKERAIELENQLLSVGDLNEAEKEYLEEYQEILNEGEITEKERRILDRMANRAGISEDRIKELEKFV